MDDLRLALILAGVLLIVGIYAWEVVRRRRRAGGARRDPGGSASRPLTPGMPREDPPPEPSGFAAESPGAVESLPDETIPAITLGDLGQLAPAWDEASRTVPAAGLAGGPDLPDGPGHDGGPDFPDEPDLFDAPNGAPAAERHEPSLAGEPLLVAVTVMARPGNRFTGPEVRAALAELDFALGERDIFHHRDAAVGGARGAPGFSVANVVEPGSFDPSTLDGLETPGLVLFTRLPGAGGVETYDGMLEAGRALAAALGGELRDDTRSTLTAQAIEDTRGRIAAHLRRSTLGTG